jgi:hypothetical protein
MTTRDDITMGTMVPHKVCDRCTGKEPEPEPVKDIEFVSVSLVTFSDENIRQVAESLGVPEKVVRDNLAGKGPAIPGLSSAFYRITGCYPFKTVGADRSEP